MKKIGLVFCLVLFFSVSFQMYAQWEWQNPLPQGNPLSNLFVIDSTHIWATGQFGALIYTDDGVNWSLNNSINTMEDLKGIYFISKEMGWITTQTSDKVFKTTNGGKDWQETASMGYQLSNMSFFNEQIGILTGKNHIAKTIDGGVNWFTTFESNELTFGKISFINDSVGWVSSNSNKIFHTTDQGLSWEEQRISTGNIISSVQFMNDSTGWIISYSNSPQGPSVLKTTDGGINWLEKIHLSQYKFTSMFFLNSQTGWVVSSGHYIYKTTDGGENWDQTLQSFYGECNSIFFNDTSTGWAVYSSGDIFSTTDGGNEWVEISSGLNMPITDIVFADVNIGFSSMHTYLLKTSDGGANWTAGILTPGVFNVLNDIYFYDSMTGFIMGFCNEQFQCYGGTLSTTTDGGNNWISRFPNVPSDILGFYSAFFLTDKYGFIGGGGAILKTTNFGNSWVRTDVDRYIVDIFFIDSLKGWALASSGGVYKTSNAGNSWSLIHLDEGVISEKIVFINPEVGYKTGGILKKSTDGGFNWFNTAYYAESVVFNDSSNGYLLGSHSIYRTSDGGNDWTIMTEIPTNYTINKMTVVDDKYFWVAGDNGCILKYTDTTVTGINIDSWNNKITNFSLSQNYPNPFNPSTSIQYAISSTQFVTLKVYDLLGREVATLVNEEKPAGSYNVEFRMQNLELSSGIYFYQLRAGDPSSSSGQSFIE
ncbi:MAG: YCF48-related protein, partial [Ignavibacteriaceae bacterium]